MPEPTSDDRSDSVAPTGGAGADPADTAVAERYRLLLELSPDAVAVHQEGAIVYANSAALAFARLDEPADMLGRPIADFVHPDELRPMTERIAGMRDRPGASTEPREVIMVDAHGVPRPMEVTSVRTVWHGRAAYQVILRDITAHKAAESALRRQAALLDHVSNAVIAVADDMTIRSWNPAAETMYGRTASDALGRDLGEVLGARVDPHAAVSLGGAVDQVHRRSDTGRSFLAHLSVTIIDDGFLIVAEPNRRPLVERLGSVLAALHQAIIVVREDGTIELANPAAGTMLGPQAVAGASVHRLSLDFADGGSPIERCLRNGEAITDATATITTPTGERWLSCSCRPIDDDGRDVVALVSFLDITDRHRERTQLVWEADHDPVTGLYNRAGIIHELESQLSTLRAEDNACCVAIFYIDLDNFKIVNDSLGHAVGDEVLHTVGQRLAAVTPDEAAVGRTGGDEFVVVTTLGIACSAEEVEHQIDNIRGSVFRPVSVSGRADPLEVEASIGVATVQADDDYTATDLLRDADIALHQARKTSRASYVRFRTQHREEMQRRQRIEEELRRALDADPGCLEIHYQPIVSTDDGTLVGLEALLRWRHPELGSISPAEFIPVAEESNLIDRVGAYVLGTAAAEVAATTGLRGVTLCVNVSRRELTDGLFITRLRETFERSGLAPEALCLEITESALAPIDSDLLALLRDVRELGTQVSLDDFGTGASSLSEFYRLPVNVLKTAKSFVDALDEHHSARSILAGIVTMAHAAGMRVVAEGVETSAQAETVAEVGCDLAQGYHFGRPAPLADVFASGVRIRADRTA
ncbi:sensor domain-containing protein [Gordonia terrae]|uniref:sensor domain-containing protein n=1 Tax=Gordonia terrae TaxID=2055 RepID=UPI003F6AD1F1